MRQLQVMLLSRDFEQQPCLQSIMQLAVNVPCAAPHQQAVGGQAACLVLPSAKKTPVAASRVHTTFVLSLAGHLCLPPTDCGQSQLFWPASSRLLK